MTAVFLCLLASFASSASATSVVGTIKDASGANLASGKILLTLSQEGTVSDPALILALTVSCTITSGAIQSCTVRDNNDIAPAGTFYRVRILTSSGSVLMPERQYTITGASWDIGAQVPLASAPVAAEAYQEFQDEGVAQARRRKADFQGAGVSLSDDAPNEKTIVAIPGITKVIPTGPLNGVNTDFSFPRNIDATQFYLIHNGLLQREGEDFAIITANSVRMTIAPGSTDNLFAYMP